MSSSTLRPTCRATLAKAVADLLVVAADEGAKQAALSYWYRSRPWVGSVVEALHAVADPQVRRCGQALLEHPGDPQRYWVLRDLLAEQPCGCTEALFDAAWRAECHTRIGFHLGSDYRADEPPIDVEPSIDVEQLRALPAGTPLAAGDRPAVLVVVPFRDRDSDRGRLRNLLACLLALRDQDYPRERYQVTVVESDAVPRWRDVLEPLCDQYVFARRDGAFNKSWAVNAAVVHTGGNAELVSVLDADVLCDRRFLSRNVARFAEPGTGGHLTYRDMFCLDPAASRRAVRSRLYEGCESVPLDRLRGFLLRRPPGACIWLRAEAFRRIGGMDERYEGWGGEDNDFAFRVDLETPLDTYRDDLLHLHHPPASQLALDGRNINDHIPPLSWSAAFSEIGRLPEAVLPEAVLQDAAVLPSCAHPAGTEGAKK